MGRARTAKAAATAALILLGLLGAPRPARADQGTLGLRNMLDQVEPAIPGVTIQVLSSAADQLVVQNTTATPLSILAPTGEPFLLVGPQGALANLNSEWWYRTNGPGGATIPPGLNPKAPPTWARVSSDPSWGWFDPRLPQNAILPQVAPGVAVPISGWTVPMAYGDRPVTLKGHLQYQQPTGTLLARVATPLPPSAGLTLSVVPGGSTPALFATWSGRQTATILGQAGEPFVRFSAVGVEVNLASPTWAFSARIQGQPSEGVVDPVAPPRWKLVDTAPRLSWLEPRAQYGPGAPPTDVQDRSRATDLVSWTIPVVVGSQRLAVRGVTRWVPNDAAGSPSRALKARSTTSHRPITWVLPALVAVAILGGAGWLALRQIRRLKHRPQGEGYPV